ncbi:alanine racemase-like protein [Comamonas sp. AG1104]|nr:alanine racemase-like protein [Comamonas sp. AG1104]
MGLCVWPGQIPPRSDRLYGRQTTDRYSAADTDAQIQQYWRHAQLPAFSALRVRGLMTLALFSSDAERVRQCFVRLRNLREQLRQSVHASIGLQELSMGMSGDFEIAIEEGATVVRVGQAIFGARALPDSHYWLHEPHA